MPWHDLAGVVEDGGQCRKWDLQIGSVTNSFCRAECCYNGCFLFFCCAGTSAEWAVLRYPENLTVANMLYYLAVPTLTYQVNTYNHIAL
jgi:hypothetical protein